MSGREVIPGRETDRPAFSFLIKKLRELNTKPDMASGLAHGCGLGFFPSYSLRQPIPTAAKLKSNGIRIGKLGLSASQAHLEPPCPAQATSVPLHDRLLAVFDPRKDQQTGSYCRGSSSSLPASSEEAKAWGAANSGGATLHSSKSTTGSYF